MIVLKKVFRRKVFVILAMLVGFVMGLGSEGYALDSFEKMQTPIYRNGKLYVFPHGRHTKSHMKYWCGSKIDKNAQAKLKVLYEVSHKNRNTVFAQGMEKFVDLELRPLLSHHCKNDPMYADLYFYQSGDMEYYDHIQYQLRTAEGKKIVKYTRATKNDKHPLNKMAAASKALGSCTNKPFCDLRGGNYLNAIYEKDEARLRKLDKQIIGQLTNSSEMQNINKLYSIFAGAVEGKGVDENKVDPFELGEFSLLQRLSVKYMGLYGTADRYKSPETCLQKGAVRITKKGVIPVVKFEDQYGISQGSVGGDVFGQVYSINKEFVPLCKTICDPGGVDASHIMANLGKMYQAKQILRGVDQVLTQMDCNSPEVKQFERNLISLTIKRLREMNQKSSKPVIKSTPLQTKRHLPAAVPEQKTLEEKAAMQPSREPRGRGQARQRTRREPTTETNLRRSPRPRNRALRQPAPTPAPVPNQKTREQLAKENMERTQRHYEKQQNMYKEIQQASAAIQEKYKVKLLDLTQRMKKVTTHEERLALQKEVSAIQQATVREMQEVMTEIKKRYQ